MSLRAEHRRNGREAGRRCLTVSDAFLINRMRRLPSDHPSRGLRKRKNRPWRPRMAYPTYTDPAQAWRYLRVIRASAAARKVSKWLKTHPGPQARCTPEVIFLAMFLAAEVRGRYLRSDLCAVINGLDATILHHLGLCDNKTLRPISYSEVQEQVLRLENAPFGLLFPGPEPHTRDDADDNAVSQATIGLIHFNVGMLLASVPKRALAKIAAAALDATAFPAYARVRDYRVQAEVDQAIREAIERGDPDPVPDGVILGADSKLQRCKHDPAARTSRRTASSETNYRSDYFNGYFAKLLTASRAYYQSHDNFHLKYDIAPYVLALSCDPASDNNAPIARELCLALKDAHPALKTVTSDREFTPRPSFVQSMHANGIATIMDYPWPQTKKLHKPTVGQRNETLYQSCGDFFPLALPDRYKTLPDPDKLTDNEKFDWFDDRSAWRYVPNSGPDSNGTIQFICPQCAGHVKFAANTRMGKYRHGNHPALSLGPPFTQQLCCTGSISIRVEDLNQWQPVPWGTRAHQQLYAAGRNRIENTNGIAKDGGGISKKSCRAPGVPAHSMAVLALAVVNNVKFADEDPLADPPNDHMPEAELSLLCITPALDNTTPNGHTTPNGAHTGPLADLPPRAPP